MYKIILFASLSLSQLVAYSQSFKPLSINYFRGNLLTKSNENTNPNLDELSINLKLPLVVKHSTQENQELKSLLYCGANIIYQSNSAQLFTGSPKYSSFELTYLQSILSKFQVIVKLEPSYTSDIFSSPKSKLLGLQYFVGITKKINHKIKLGVGLSRNLKKGFYSTIPIILFNWIDKNRNAECNIILPSSLSFVHNPKFKTGNIGYGFSAAIVGYQFYDTYMINHKLQHSRVNIGPDIIFKINNLYLKFNGGLSVKNTYNFANQTGNQTDLAKSISPYFQSTIYFSPKDQ